MRIPLLNIFDEDMRDVVSGAAFAFALRIMGAGFGFGFNLLLARILGAGGVGIYYLSLTVTTIATVIGRLGLDNSLLRYASVGAANHNWDQVAGIYRQALYLALAASGFTSVLMFMFAPWIACDIFKKPALITLLRIMAFSVVPFSLLNLYAELLKAFKKTGQASFIQGTGIPLACLLMLICLAWTTLSVDEIALIYVIASISVLSAGIWLWRKAAPQISGLRGKFCLRRLIATSLPLFWVSSMSMLMSWTDTIMLGVWMESDSVGLYNAAARIAMLTSFILVAVNTIAAPKFASMYAQGDYRALEKFARQITLIMILFATPVLTIFLVWPKLILKLFGPEFIFADKALTVLALGQFVNVATGSVGYLLMMSGHEKLMRNNIIFAAVLNVAFNIILIPRFGIVGAASSTAAALSVMNIVSMGLVYWKTGLLTFPYPKSVL